eukprot:8535956-Pyramimonas_sp.AAC.1
MRDDTGFSPLLPPLPVTPPPPSRLYPALLPLIFLTDPAGWGSRSQLPTTGCKETPPGASGKG